MQERMAYEKRTADADLAFQAFERGRRKGKAKGARADRRAREREEAEGGGDGGGRGGKNAEPQLNPIERLRKMVTGNAGD